MPTQVEISIMIDMRDRFHSAFLNTFGENNTRKIIFGDIEEKIKPVKIKFLTEDGE